jgi:simple sugar transport system substrate-binding protein
VAHALRVVVAALALMAIAVGTSACGDSDDEGTNNGEGTNSSGQKGALVDRSDIRIEFAMVGVAGDPFYNVIKNGAAQAEKDFGVEVEYKETPQYDLQEQARLVRAAIAREPDGLVVSNEGPDILDPVIGEAVEAGIPTIVVNAIGEDTLEKTGALGYIGQDEFEVGVRAGEELKAEGVQKVLCINPAVGSAPLDARCAGLEEAYGSGNVQVVATTLEDPTASRNRMEAALADTDADGMLVTAITVNGEEALQALENSGKQDEITLAGMDLTPPALEAVESGDILFLSDQQQYLQGYLPVLHLVKYLQYGMQPPELTPTGPAYVTEGNATEAIELVEQGIR